MGGASGGFLSGTSMQVIVIGCPTRPPKKEEREAERAAAREERENEIRK